MTRYEQMLQEFKEFHEANPVIYKLFCKFTFQVIAMGLNHYSGFAVMHRVRWETQFPKYEEGKEFKVNNNHVPFYARMFMTEFPTYEGFFRVREQVSRKAPAVTLPPLGPEDYYDDDDIFSNN